MIKYNELKYSWLDLSESTISKTDFLFWAEDNYNIPQNINELKFYYNQWTSRRTRNWCALFWCAGAIWDLTGYEFSEDELLSILILAEKDYWWKEDYGMYMSKAVDCVRNWWNEKFPNEKLLSFRTVVWDDKFKEALTKGHSLVVWYRTSPEYYKDSQDDGVIQWEDFPKKWGHLVRCNFNTAIKIDDNYYGKKTHNTYINNKILTLKNNWVFFPSAYLFLKEITMEEEIRNGIDLEGAKELYDEGVWNGLNPREPMSRQEVMAVLARLNNKNK